MVLQVLITGLPPIICFPGSMSSPLCAHLALTLPLAAQPSHISLTGRVPCPAAVLGGTGDQGVKGSLINSMRVNRCKKNKIKKKIIHLFCILAVQQKLTEMLSNTIWEGWKLHTCYPVFWFIYHKFPLPSDMKSTDCDLKKQKKKKEEVRSELETEKPTRMWADNGWSDSLTEEKVLCTLMLQHQTPVYIKARKAGQTNIRLSDNARQ